LSYFHPGVNFNSEITNTWDLPVSLPLSAPGPPISVLSPHGCHAPAPCLKGAVRTARVRPDSCPHPDHAPPLTASPRSPPTTIVRSRPRVSNAPRHRRRSATATASAPIAAEPHVPRRHPRLTVRTPSSLTPPVSRAAVAFTTPPCYTRAVVPSTRRHLYHELASHCRPCTGEAPPCPSPHRLPCAGDAAARTLAPGRAGPGCGPHTLRRLRPSWARLGRTRAAQADCTDTVPLGRRRIRPSGI
jgi:hypothetical protein